MLIITGLSDKAREDLIDFCRTNLKPDYDPVVYADGLIQEADFSDGAHFEIRGLHTRTGNPVTTSYGEDDDLRFEEIDENGDPIQD